jgi:hypothetical protein
VTTADLLAALRERGITLKALGDVLRVTPRDALTDDLRQAIKAHKVALIALLEPERSLDRGTGTCPDHWLRIPELPQKGRQVITQGACGRGSRYRERLFGRWYIVRFEPTISDTHVAVVDADRVRRLFADLDEFYRWAWAEAYAPAVRLRSPN